MVTLQKSLLLITKLRVIKSAAVDVQQFALLWHHAITSGSILTSAILRVLPTPLKTPHKQHVYSIRKDNIHVASSPVSVSYSVSPSSLPPSLSLSLFSLSSYITSSPAGSLLLGLCVCVTSMHTNQPYIC